MSDRGVKRVLKRKALLGIAILGNMPGMEMGPHSGQSRPRSRAVPHGTGTSGTMTWENSHKKREPQGSVRKHVSKHTAFVMLLNV